MADLKGVKMKRSLILGIISAASLSLLLLFAVGYRGQGEEDGGVFKIEQSADGEVLTRYLSPLQGSQDVVEFYGYTGGGPNTGFEKSDSCVLIPYRGPDGVLSLVVILDRNGNGSGGTARLTFSGLPQGATVALRDDDTDFRDTMNFNPPNASFKWSWDAAFGDGVVISNLGDSFQLKVKPSFEEGISNWEVLSGDFQNPERIELDLGASLTAQSSTNRPPSASFEISPMPLVNQPVTFDASSSEDPDGRIVSYEWDFNGDGQFTVSTEEPKVEHSYKRGGEYLVSLRVTDDSGTQSVYTQRLEIEDILARSNREISAAYVTPGSSFRVEVEITSRVQLSGLGLEENLPEGWALRPISNDGAAFKEKTNRWVFVDALEAGEKRKIIYEVDVPPAEQMVTTSLPRGIDIKGRIYSASPQFEQSVEGESELRLSEVLPIRSVIAHYDRQREAIDLRMGGEINDSQLRWAADMWVTDEIVPNSGGELVTFPKMKELVFYNSRGLPAGEEFERADVPGYEVRRNIFTQLPFNFVLLSYRSKLSGEDSGEQYEGDYFNVQVTIKASGRQMIGVGLEESLPEDWEMKPVDNGGAFYKQSTQQWVFPEPILPGGQRKVSYKVRVPQSEEKGDYEIQGRFSEYWSDYTADVMGDTAVQVVDSLPVKVVISRWNVEEGNLDLSQGNSITYDQVKRALSFWLEDEVVPYTGGETVSFTDIKEIVAYWLEGKPINQSLE